MNKGMLSVGIIFLSVLALVLLNLLSNYSTGSELDYYLLKETVDAAMVDAIDEAYLRNCGLYRIDKEKFAESFLYRFANSVETTRGYKVYIYDINDDIRRSYIDAGFNVVGSETELVLASNIVFL